MPLQPRKLRLWTQASCSMEQVEAPPSWAGLQLPKLWLCIRASLCSWRRPGAGRICPPGCSCSCQTCGCRPGLPAPRSRQEPGTSGSPASSEVVGRELLGAAVAALPLCSPYSQVPQEGQPPTILEGSRVSASTAWPLSAPSTHSDLRVGLWPSPGAMSGSRRQTRVLGGRGRWKAREGLGAELPVLWTRVRTHGASSRPAHGHPRTNWHVLPSL